MRGAAYIAVAVLLLLVQANLYRLFGPLGGWVGARWIHGMSPNLVLPLVVFVGVHEPSMSKGALLAFAIGYAEDILAGAPVGLFTFVSVAVWWLSRIAGVRLKRRYKLDAPKGVRGRNSDNTLINERLGWTPSVRLEDGMRRTYEWIYGEMTKRTPRAAFV